MKNFEQLPKLHPSCRYVSWIVRLGEGGTTNPMTRKSALKMHNKRLLENKYSSLIRCFTCVSVKILENSRALK